jgi:hypothetical protein
VCFNSALSTLNNDEVFERNNATQEKKNLIDKFSAFDVQVIQSKPKQ